MFFKMQTVAWVVGATLVSSLISAPMARAQDKSITGAGATFPAPLYTRWAAEYEKATGVKLNYQSIGSGGGIRMINEKQVDFGASDAPQTAEDLDKRGQIQFPMTIGGVVPVINVPGIESNQLKLSGATLADIYLGKIKKWNDAAIKADNPDVNLPDQNITVVHRADGSGTTWIFTNYLSKVSSDWKDKVGSNTAVEWPVGLGGKGNEGVSATVQKVKGSIGYVEYAYALVNKMTATQLKNKDGNFVSPTAVAFAAAAANADWSKAPGFYLVLTEQPGAKTWPISGASFILVYKAQASAGKALEVLKFFDWCYKNGQKTSEELNYVAIPDNVSALVEKVWGSEIKADGKPVWNP